MLDGCATARRVRQLHARHRRTDRPTELYCVYIEWNARNTCAVLSDWKRSRNDATERFLAQRHLAVDAAVARISNTFAQSNAIRCTSDVCTAPVLFFLFVMSTRHGISGMQSLLERILI